MFEPIRGGTRGGQAEFKWSDVSADKDREHYLGHSINAPTGRWQKNKDVHWYNREQNQDDDAKRAEIQKIKKAEAEVMAQALGFAPTNSAESILNGAGASDENKEVSEAPEGELSPTVDNQSESAKKLEKRMRKLEKRARKAEKKERKEKRRLERLRDDDYDRERVHDTRYKERRSRSRSPPRRNTHDERDRHHGRRSASPPPRGRLRSRSPPRRDGRNAIDCESLFIYCNALLLSLVYGQTFTSLILSGTDSIDSSAIKLKSKALSLEVSPVLERSACKISQLILVLMSIGV
ncbi:kinase phosphorylation [Pyrrhoderma noxium]|uniref:Kinase phosphorylation n=1 Tax=Pyrrhoderma noxium TaxID=2282107 RepID=A0A286UH70_9AGAM|nr:kinase phosphorylation [Pyrrhoderma noxium]